MRTLLGTLVAACLLAALTGCSDQSSSGTAPSSSAKPASSGAKATCQALYEHDTQLYAKASTFLADAYDGKAVTPATGSDLSAGFATVLPTADAELQPSIAMIGQALREVSAAVQNGDKPDVSRLHDTTVALRKIQETCGSALGVS